MVRHPKFLDTGRGLEAGSLTLAVSVVIALCSETKL